jgi:hypothetical protein
LSYACPGWAHHEEPYTVSLVVAPVHEVGRVAA